MLKIRDVFTGSRIRNFSIQDTWSRVKKISDPGSASKNLSIFNPKNCFQALGNVMIRDVQYIPDPDLNFYPSRIPDPGFKRLPDPESGSATLDFTCIHFCLPRTYFIFHSVIRYFSIISAMKIIMQENWEHNNFCSLLWHSPKNLLQRIAFVRQLHLCTHMFECRVHFWKFVVLRNS